MPEMTDSPIVPHRLTRAREMIWWLAIVGAAGIGFVVGKRVVSGNPLLSRDFSGWLKFTVVSSTLELEHAIKDYLHNHNRDPRPFVWTKTADQILESLKRFCMLTSNSGH